jgi:hypothetical protein
MQIIILFIRSVKGDQARENWEGIARSDGKMLTDADCSLTRKGTSQCALSYANKLSLTGLPVYNTFRPWMTRTSTTIIAITSRI